MVDKRDEARRRREAAAAAEEAEKRRQEMKRFLKREHGKQAYAHLAHEGALDRGMWDRPDDELKRLGELDPHHVASGGAKKSGERSVPKPLQHVRGLEAAVQSRLGRSPSPATLVALPPSQTGSRLSTKLRCPSDPRVQVAKSQHEAGRSTPKLPPIQ